MRAIGLFLGVTISAITSAQNFPEIPENWLKPMTPRAMELLARLQVTGLVPQYDFSRQISGPPLQSTITKDCSMGLALASAHLALGRTWIDTFRIDGWIKHLPLVEALLIEINGDLSKHFPDLASTIALIKQRCHALGRPIDLDRYQRFSDVPEGHWADEAIHRMRELGILRGYPDNTFRG